MELIMNYKIKTPDNQFLGKGLDEVITAAELDGWDIDTMVKVGILEPVEIKTEKKEAK